MYIEQKSKNSWQVKRMKDGVTYYVSFDHKPSVKEGTIALNSKILELESSTNDTLSVCIDKYIKSKSFLSPNTIRTYVRYKNTIPTKYLSIKLTKFTNFNFQSLINEYCKNRDPKTTKSLYGFLMSVLSMFTKNNFKITLPQLVKKKVYIPTVEDVKLIIDKVDSKYRSVFILASYGLRYGEIAALTMNDIHENYVDVNKSVAYGLHNEKIIKSPKTFESTRKVSIPTSVYKRIKKDGLRVPSEKQCCRILYEIQDDNDIPRFSIHKFRHFFASYLASQNVPSANIMQMGGWASDNIMKTVYTHAYELEKQITIPVI